VSKIYGSLKCLSKSYFCCTFFVLDILETPNRSVQIIEITFWIMSHEEGLNVKLLNAIESIC